MDQVESFVGLGTISKPGAWAFGDCLELGVPGEGCLTWEESKSHLALWAVCSQPLFLGNDVRPGHMQQRLLDLMLNKDMLFVNQNYVGNAGDRVWTGRSALPYSQCPVLHGSIGLCLSCTGPQINTDRKPRYEMAQAPSARRSGPSRCRTAPWQWCC